MLGLNNAHTLHDIKFTWIPKQDYSSEGHIVFPRGTRYKFKGVISDNITLINKVFHEGLDRDNIQFVVNTVAQYPFKKDDIIEDDNGKKYKVVNPYHKKEATQAKFLKSDFTSKEWWLGVEGNE